MAIKIAGTEVINDNKELVLAKLKEINKSIADTAVDIFVYDTRKDSDGGAWRKRTQHTSWYNETLNTATRGSRKEFPAVAVIVVESTGPVTIYDADDPDLPMWMSATTSASMFESTITSCFMLNGVLGIGCNGYDFYRTDFLRDEMREYQPVGQWTRGVISGRNGNPTAINVSSTGIASRYVNDVAMTVLPNAPIDAATGLPVPTIAVATDGGTSIIKDDGNIVDITYSNFNAHGGVAFVDGNVLITNDSGGTNNRFQKIHTIPSSDLSAGTGYEGQKSSSEVITFTGDRVLYGHDFSYSYNNVNHTTDGRRIADNVKSFGHTGGFVQYDGTRDTGVMFNNATSSFATGYQVGDIKLATLSDTDDTNFSESSANLVTNGEFSTSDLSSYSIVNTEGGTETFSVSGGTATYSISGAGNYAHRRQNVAVEAGKTYQITTYVSAASGSNARVEARANGTGTLFPSYLNGGGEWFATGQNTDGSSINGTSPVGTHVATLVCTTSGNLQVGFRAYQNGSVSANHIRVREIAAVDRSVNQRGLVGIGSLTKSAVATGADLVAYSGFSSSNYLQQPYNSDLDFGTGDFCVMGWVNKTGTSSKGIIDRNNGSSYAFYVYTTSTNQIRISMSGSTILTTTDTLSTGMWQLFTMRRSSGTLFLGINGNEVSVANSTDVTLADAVTTLGVNYSGTVPFDGYLALWRISATAPSPEQILKMYNDEKFLFQDNAQATLYGSSDAVTALAYDDSTNLLHVGTSAGRSDFQGLRRVNNTTTAVGSAISASNGLIADD